VASLAGHRAVVISNANRLGNRRGANGSPFFSASRQEIYLRLSGSLVVDPSALISLGWTPPLATPLGLARLMQASEALRQE
jgi:hypothetical protein